MVLHTLLYEEKSYETIFNIKYLSYASYRMSDKASRGRTRAERNARDRYKI